MPFGTSRAGRHLAAALLLAIPLRHDAGQPSGAAREYLEVHGRNAGWRSFRLLGEERDRCRRIEVEVVPDAAEGKWLGGTVCCTAASGRCEYSIDLPYPEGEACPDAALCYALCWTALDEFEQLYAADGAGDVHGIWKRIAASHRKWRWCWLGSADEGAPRFVERLLARWHEPEDFLAMAARDEVFLRWVIDRMGDLGSAETYDKIASHAGSRCPRGRESLCRRLRLGAENAARASRDSGAKPAQ